MHVIPKIKFGKEKRKMGLIKKERIRLSEVPYRRRTTMLLDCAAKFPKENEIAPQFPEKVTVY